MICEEDNVLLPLRGILQDTTGFQRNIMTTTKKPILLHQFSAFKKTKDNQTTQPPIAILEHDSNKENSSNALRQLLMPPSHLSHIEDKVEDSSDVRTITQQQHDMSLEHQTPIGGKSSSSIFGEAHSQSILHEITNSFLSSSKHTTNISFKKPASSLLRKTTSSKPLCDRFIPSRVESDQYKLFLEKSESLEKNNDTTAMSCEQNSDELNSNDVPSQSEQAQAAQYSNLLQAHFYDLSNSSYPYLASAGSSNNSNNMTNKLFTYNNEQPTPFSSFSSSSSSSTSSSTSYFNRSIFQGLSSSNITSYEHSATSSEQLNASSCASSSLPFLSAKGTTKPYKVLEAPTLKNDFYLNLLDWSATNLVGVGLENSVYVLSGSNQTVKTQFALPDSVAPIYGQDGLPSGQQNIVCSVAWSQRSDHIAVGDRDGKLYLFDLVKNKFLRVMHNHAGRVGSIAWNGNVVATGSRDKNVVLTDIRDHRSEISLFQGHKQEICGMRWSFDEQTLASGGNDNKVFLWSLKMGGRLAKISQSRAAVKAIGFSPHQHNILAFGGGTADRCIRIFDTQQLKQIDCIDTGSQVCNLIFAKNSKQIISTHGYSLNQIIVWNQSNMKKLATLTGHTQRVLYLAESPCGQNILTGAADETIRFWNIFKNPNMNELSPSSIGLR